ncbi:single-stranded DNA-binding protein [Corynebacterium belfantii]|uniref:single-stranded DNA-binding protein n=1 Tax=Corynebacterium belfantii TaxID=2014537 RepID=UPI003907F799
MTNASILIDGRLVADPELKFTQSGAPVCNFRIARSDSEKLPDGSWGENRNQLFLNVNVWRELGEECAATLTKGGECVFDWQAGNTPVGGQGRAEALRCGDERLFRFPAGSAAA